MFAPANVIDFLVEGVTKRVELTDYTLELGINLMNYTIQNWQKSEIIPSKVTYLNNGETTEVRHAAENDEDKLSC